VKPAATASSSATVDARDEHIQAAGD
jgi:hypothetical protein